MARCTEALRTLDEALHQLVGCDKERSQLSAQVQQLEQEFMNYCDEPSATATRISKELEKASQVRPPPAPLRTNAPWSLQRALRTATVPSRVTPSP